MSDSSHVYVTIFENRKYEINSDICLSVMKGKSRDVEHWRSSDIGEYHEIVFLIGDNVEITKYIRPFLSDAGQYDVVFYYLMYFSYLDLTSCCWEVSQDIPLDFVTAIPFNYNNLWNTLVS